MRYVPTRRPEAGLRGLNGNDRCCSLTLRIRKFCDAALTAKAKLAGMWREKVDQHNTGKHGQHGLDRELG